MKYKPKHSNVEGLYDDVAKDLKEAVALEDRAVSRFAEILDEWIEEIFADAFNDLKLDLMLAAAKGESRLSNVHEVRLLVSIDSDLSWFTNENGNQDFRYQDFDLWKLMDNDLEEICSNTHDDLGIERARAVVSRLRTMADRLEAQANDEESH
jgi:hypothetical protein